MHRCRKGYGIFIFVLIFLGRGLTFALAQEEELFFKFPILNDGVYKISLEQARSLGYQDLEQIGIFGNAGMLPQQLDSLDLTLREIPTKKLGDELFFFLRGPHRIYVEEGEFEFQVHHYTDTLFYLLGPAADNPQVGIDQDNQSGAPLNTLYEVQFQKWEVTNLLTSGRHWYSAPIFNRERLSYNFASKSGISGPPELIVKVMGQSLAEGRMEFFHNNSLLGNVTLESIPNTTYGIKGREAIFKTDLQEANNYNIQVNFGSGDVNGTGYLSHSILAFPFSVEDLSASVYFSKQQGILQKHPAMTSWIVRDTYEVLEISTPKMVEAGDQIVFFSEPNVSQLRDISPVDLSLRKQNDKIEFVIISSPILLSQAQRLSNHKNQKGITTKVYTPQEIYDAFGYGTKDLTAIRNFLAHQYQAGGALKNVLFFGKGTFDYKGTLGGRPNLVPTYSSRSSLNPLTTFSSDDYFGFLDWGQGNWEESNAGDELLKVGIGRIPAINFREAQEAVNKIIAYENGLNMEGPWKRRLAFFADDGDNNIHLNDAESHAGFIENNHPEFEIRKLYLDRFEQLTNNGIQTSPEAKEALNTEIQEGLLILNYIGHGNETTLTAERVFTITDIQDWPEDHMLPLFVTATCEFGRQDSPFIRSGAEDLLFAERKGAIGLLTTGRPVFSSVNFALNKAFIESVFERELGLSPDLGSVFKSTKNNSLNGPFNRNFSLIGDPSMKLAIPELIAEPGEIFDILLETTTDTLKAAQQIRITGKILDPITGAIISSAQGEYNLSISDKPSEFKTLGDESSPVIFLEEENFLFRGIGSVANGEFSAEAFLPIQISESLAQGTIRVMANLGETYREAIGAKRVTIGGKSENEGLDNEGPEISIRYGTALLEVPPIIPSSTFPIKIFFQDKSGINIASSESSQALSLQINEDAPIILNSRFVAIDGNFQRGIVNTNLVNLKEGLNTIKITAWDNVGNKSQFQTSVEVRGSLRMKILEVFNYPNPADERSKFNIVHNRPNENLLLNLEVYSMKGDIIFQSSRRYPVANNVLDDLEWIFFHHKTNYPAKGTYIYKLHLQSEKDGTSDTWSGKIIIQ